MITIYARAVTHVGWPINSPAAYSAELADHVKNKKELQDLMAGMCVGESRWSKSIADPTTEGDWLSAMQAAVADLESRRSQMGSLDEYRIDQPTSAKYTPIVDGNNYIIGHIVTTAVLDAKTGMPYQSTYDNVVVASSAIIFISY